MDPLQTGTSSLFPTQTQLPTSSVLATPPNRPPAEVGYAPTIILVLVLVINVIIGVLLAGLWIRRSKNKKRKRENFVVKMSEISDEFANEVQYVSFKSAQSTSVSVTNGQQLANSTHTIPSQLPQNRDSNAEQRGETEVPSIQIQNERGFLTVPPLSQTEKALTLNLKLSSNNAYGRKLQPIPSRVARQLYEDSMDTQENMAYADDTLPLPLATRLSQPGSYANRPPPLPTSIRQPIDYDYQYVEECLPTQRALTASYTYVGDGGDNNQGGTAGKSNLAEHGPNYTYIDPVTLDQLRHIKPEHEYASIGETNAAASDGPNYTYIDNEATENGLEYYSDTTGGEGVVQSGDYYSTITVHNN
ncbi:uncharacterized protein LOC135351744 [Halichondria panicea]|uniref:uncharacterized protein LOC135351744 n=1 Tax=Halichondria panicea TaxID=6063 RepID=UPI00312B5A6E